MHLKNSKYLGPSVYVLGLRDLLTKSIKNTLDAFKDILFDIHKVYYNKGIGDVSQDVLLSLEKFNT